MEVNPRRATTLAIRWIVDFSRKRKEHTMAQRLAAEIMDAAENTGASVKKREGTSTRWPSLTVRSRTIAGREGIYYHG